MPRFVLTGAPGTGKTTLLKAFTDAGYWTVEEFARQVIRRQREEERVLIGDADPLVFLNEMQQVALDGLRLSPETSDPIIHDRGIPDLIAFATWYELPTDEIRDLGRQYRYADPILMCPLWPGIFINDEDRKLTLSEADRFDRLLRDAYEELGYSLLEVPFADPPERLRFVEERAMNTSGKSGQDGSKGRMGR